MTPRTETPLLRSVRGPADLRGLAPQELPRLGAEIREFLVDAVSRTGGHLGPNLGVVELTIALHRVFESPRDRLLWDTGHQAYVHKLLTGRQDFSALRSRGGLSGYPSRAESDHDVIENSHASTALSYADGLARAHRLRGRTDCHAVAIIGDGALTGGMAWEALNNIAVADDLPLVIVVNDNGRSYAPTRGGLAEHLTALRTNPGYERILARGKDLLERTPVVGKPLYESLHGAKKGLKDFVAPQGLFEDLGLKYVGPVDGHDIAALETALRRARGFGGPVVVHCITSKGKGHAPAEQHEGDRFHAIGATPVAKSARSRPSWTSVFADEIVKVGGEREDVVALTAAMREPVGLEPFAAAYPERVLDTGIAEQHTVTSAAGLALGGLHPVVALYATFLNRAFDQVLMDVALHECGVTFVLDRAGVTGDDGPSHNGMWDLGLLQLVPGLRIAAPRDGARLRRQLREALDVDSAPTVVRYPKGQVAPDVEPVTTVAGMEVLGRPEGRSEVLLVSVGAMAQPCLAAAEALRGQVGVTVVDPCWVKPVNPALVELAAEHRLVVTVEDGGRTGGVGSAVAQALRDAGVPVPVRVLGLDQRFYAHGSRGEVLAEAGLTADDIAATIAAARPDRLQEVS
ncbi:MULTISPECIES: 1-deoxy-D-xylulose-5-phosphate synthase [Streptomyces]|uniref:1-deoxy-D-xylulose-5-phosphate synthase n=1 Tax=Streptomyces TaxID=1883 RepID=UPI00163C1403|nr:MULTISPECIES: 1-deoxy-D-xylulose-5-phosphate synthase [Streptomyces]MBC2878814.1 1-deoxy-D-xylulose-5-phosphate synthase [Streptomyces sp. TYQ1024]UBI39270.1 1-deoxy-D-xylulose-5-phosphate synthase [Streptomyces mobaraensis]UKW31851.1 1-deoxy-D-xylulose-5-phosphate synthase [Streptomyces sp. TYQ1024]